MDTMEIRHLIKNKSQIKGYRINPDLSRKLKEKIKNDPLYKSESDWYESKVLEYVESENEKKTK